MKNANAEPRSYTRKIGRCLLWMLCITLLMVAIGGSFYGKPGIEKYLTELLMPVGFSWLVLWAVGLENLVCKNIRQGAWFVLAAVSLTIVGTDPFPNACVRWLEESYVPFDPDADAPLDLIVVLGGGTSAGPNRPQAASSGDRVVYAAELFLGGHTKRLVTTGSAIPGTSTVIPSAAEQTREIWTKLGVPDSAIERLEGINTYEEMKNIRALLGESASGKRIGLLTSAWHLPRALRLARKAGFEFIPVAADYRAVPSTLLRAMPTADNLERLAMVQREYMAYFLGR